MPEKPKPPTIEELKFALTLATSLIESLANQADIDPSEAMLTVSIPGHPNPKVSESVEAFLLAWKEMVL